MIGKGSRYANALLFAESKEGERAFGGIRPRRIVSPAGVLEHVVAEGDRLDMLARYYYNDVRHWWRILDANPELINGSDLTLDGWIGSTILIPRIAEPGGES